MRSSFNSSYSSANSLNPLSYSSSSSQVCSFRRTSLNSDSSSVRFREHFPRDARPSSLATGSPISSRVSRDEQTAGLLERYGSTRKSSESSTSQFLKQRRQQQQQAESDFGFNNVHSAQRRTSFETAASTSSTMAPFSRANQPKDAQDVTQNEYISRLMAAHNRVDDLLRSRGLSAEDERKYLRAWEEIPIVREERYRRVRTPSSSSDSGLSTDNDSDRSNAEPTAAVAETFSFDKPEDETYVVFTRNFVTSKIAFCEQTVSFELDKKGNNNELVEAPFSAKNGLKKSSSRLAVSHAKSFKIPHSDLSVEAQIILPIFTKKSVSATLAVPKRKIIQKKKVSKKVQPEPAVECSPLFRQLSVPSETKFNMDNVHKPVKVQASFSAIDIAERARQAARQRRTYNEVVRVQQQNVLASLKRKKNPAIPSTAEISIQHCSFYQKFAESNVRLNLRMTERAPKNAKAVVALPAPPRVAYARLDVDLIMTKPPPRRTKTQELPKPKQVIGKLNRSFTVELEKDEKEQRKVNRLKIPEYFLQSNAEIMEDINSVKNGLKRVPIIGGFLIGPKPKENNQPQSTLKRSGAIRRKAKPDSAPYSDFCPAQSKIPSIKIEKPPDPPDTSHRLRRAPPKNCSKNYLNLHGSLEQSATPRGATNTESQIFAELSDTDKILIERYRSRIHIPRPKAIIRALSPINALRVFSSRENLSSSSESLPTFLNRKLPRCRSPTPCRESRPLKLSPCKIVKKSTHQRRHWLDFEIELKRVDFEKHRMRAKPHRRLIKWIPRWRRRGTDEEVEEVEEEEEVEETENNVQQERVKTKSFTEDADGMTEGEKAMAAAKRRHEEEQQAKLLDYEERRRIEREKEEEELKKLKEKQERRRIEREQEEKELEEKRKAEEDRRRQQEEERKAKLEEEKKKKEEEKNKRNQFMGGGYNPNGGRSFVVPKKSGAPNDKFGNIVQAKQEMGMTKEQQEEAKRVYMNNIRKGIAEVSEVSPAELKQKIKELHQRICKLEAEKYDQEKRHERQEYDLKELNERQRQVTRNSALKKGIDPSDVGNSRYPPKVQIVSKYDRQIDRRNFRERRSVFDRKNAHPCFPGIPPPPAIFEKIISPVEEEEVAADEDEE